MQRSRTPSIWRARSRHSAASPHVELSKHARGITETIGRADHLIFVMADGLGMNLIERHAVRLVLPQPPRDGDAGGVSVVHCAGAHIARHRTLAC